jgi:transcriptional regulator with GAF, ATPase, and Fis domain
MRTNINLNQSLEESMDPLLAQAGELLGNQAIAIYRLQGDQEEPVTQANQTLPGKELASIWMPFGQAILHQALRTRQPIAIPCTANRLSAYETMGAGRQVWTLPASTAYQAVLAVPVVVKQQIYGGVVLYYTEPRRFTQDDTELAVLYSHLVALAMENSSLREHLQQACVVTKGDGLTREVSDMVTQMRFSVRLITEALPRVLERHPAEGRRCLEELSLHSRSTLAQMRALRRRLSGALTDISFVSCSDD